MTTRSSPNSPSSPAPTEDLRLNILHVISGLNVGGAETFLARMVPKLQQRGVNQTVVSLGDRGTLAAQLEAAGVPVVGLQIHNPLRAPQAIARLTTIIHQVKPDVTQGWMYHGDLAAMLAHRLAGRPGRLFWGIRCSDMNLSDYSLQLRTVVRLCALLSNSPDTIVANSQAGADAHRTIGYRSARIEIVGNGIDIEQFRPDPGARQAVRAELGIADNTKLLMHVARVDPMKDHAGLLKALGMVPGLTSILVGAGTERLTLPPSVTALGRRGDVARLLAGADIIASCSAFGEGFPNALAEGMSCGLVPVATDVGDSQLIVGDTGLMVSRRDPVAFAAALRSLMEWPEGKWRDAGAAARARITDSFTLDKAVGRFEALYRTSA